jgi:5-dehydro-4-deoxyglucarate dehydratase
MTMSPDSLRSRLTGAIAFPVTPFRSDLALDEAGLRANLRAILAHPPAAIVAAGGTGELYSLTPTEHLDVVRIAVEESAGRVPVIAGVGFNAALGAELASQAAAVGADGLLVFPPYYPNADERGLLDYYTRIASASLVGVLIYSRDWFHPGPAFVEQLAAIPTLIGWKDGQGDVRRLQILMDAIGDRLRWVGGAGDDLVPAYYAAGVRAYTSSVSNLAPRLSLTLHEWAAAGDPARLRPLMDVIVPLYAFRARRRGYEVSAMKALMDLLGLAGGPVRPPLSNVRPDEMPLLRDLADAFRPWNAHG